VNETRALAESIASLKYTDLSSEVINKAKELILDNLGCQLAFATLPWSKIIYQYVQEKQGSKGCSTVSYYGLKTIVEDAAFANAAFGHGFEMDDDESHTTSHPGVVIIPAALAMGEAQGISGREFLVAVIAGYDTMLRVGMAARTMVNRSFHTTAVLGPFGSAASTSKILGMNQDAILNALSIAASEAGGISEYAVSGGSVKRLHAGFASQSGVKASILAKLGVTGPVAPIEGKKGICQAFANEYYPEEITRELGKEFRIFWTGHKPYCCCQAQHSTIDAVSELTAEYSVKPDDIEEIIVEQMPRDIIAVGNVIRPTDITSAQFCGRFGVALRILKGSNGFRDYNMQNIRNPELLEFSKKVKYVADLEMEKMPPGAAPTRLTMKLKNGVVYSKRIDYAKGMPQNPLTHREIEDKFKDQATTVISDKKAEEIIKAVNNLDDLDNIQNLVKFLVVNEQSNLSSQISV
jgi:2-methylcitrate dehydratase PrpD